MPRLIDADALKNHYSWWKGGTKENTLDEQKEIFDTIVNLQPTIDPVKRGKWIPINERAAKCSLCGAWEYTNGRDKTGTAIIHKAIKHYCPNCGARMDG